MGRRPLIGINCHADKVKKRPHYLLDYRYVEGIERSGGDPVLLPLFRSASEAGAHVRRVDGLMFTGGDDMHPRRWGEQGMHRKATPVRPEKEESDLLLAREALRSRRPVFAICLGCQVISVARGGPIDQHLADLPGMLPVHVRGKGPHAIRIERGSRLAKIMRTTRPRVNSFHHQAIRKPGRGLHVVARAPDGVIEGFEGTGKRFLLGVQWHPERMLGRPEHLRLFRALVEAAAPR
ncbi:MAG: gamma-glutamyl-gamma-aminobutyrate hydrolase family protein [Planctomycetota bacterium]|jgi:putative glutamine amidotransferase